MAELPRTKANAWLDRYNYTINANLGYPLALLRRHLAHVGKNPYIEPDFCCVSGKNISLGDNVFLNHDVTLDDTAPITLGDDINIAPKVLLATSQANLAAPITIEDGVWLGASVVVCGGVRIGANTIVAAGSVVCSSLPANVLAAGRPARVMRYL